MSGEQLHDAGRTGARRAKVWLDMTTRVDTQWVNPQPAAMSKLTFNWANPVKGTFSFDIGGIMKGGPLDSQIFVGESKYYLKGEGSLGSMYKIFLAQCYSAYIDNPAMCDQFMFITWHPFSVTTWPKLTDSSFVEKAVRENSEQTIPPLGPDANKAEPDLQVCRLVAERLWLIVLSERQERELIMSPRDLALIKMRRTEEDYIDV